MPVEQAAFPSGSPKGMGRRTGNVHYTMLPVLGFLGQELKLARSSGEQSRIRASRRRTAELLFRACAFKKNIEMEGTVKRLLESEKITSEVHFIGELEDEGRVRRRPFCSILVGSEDFSGAFEQGFRDVFWDMVKNITATEQVTPPFACQINPEGIICPKK